MILRESRKLSLWLLSAAPQAFQHVWPNTRLANSLFWVRPRARREIVFWFLHFASHTFLHLWPHTHLANSVLGIFPSVLRKFTLAFLHKTSRAFQNIETILAHSARASGIESIAVESFRTFPEMTILALVWRAGLNLPTHTNLAARVLVCTIPLH